MSAPQHPVARVVFTTPRTLPDARTLEGRVVVLDIAFAASGMGTPFEEVTGRFLADLGDRLAAWVDHHDHEFHARYAGDPRFVLATKAEHGACPEMVTPELVERIGPVDTIVTHLDFDGLYAAAKWLLGGREPYAGADDDARAVDTRTGEPGPTGRLIDRALRARFRDEALKHRVVRFLLSGAKDREHRAVIKEAAAEFDRMAAETDRLASRFAIRGRVAYVDGEARADPTTRPSCSWPARRERRSRSCATRAWSPSPRPSTRAGTSSRSSASAAACPRACPLPRHASTKRYRRSTRPTTGDVRDTDHVSV